MNEAEAVKEIERCLQVLFYRDARSLNKVGFSILSGFDNAFFGPMCP